MLPGQLAPAGAAVGLPAVVGTAEAEAPSREAVLLAAEVESALADPPPVVGPPTTIAEACITRTRASDSRILRFINRPP